ncbi:MAG TPA: TonB family protein [Gemmatimonadales bacterium]|nr:TonB family protein [Gemmatimonadales bacterium]
MVLTLFESKRKIGSRRSLGLGLVSMAVHTAVIVAIAVATVHAGRSDTQVKVDTTVVLLEPEQQKPAEQPPLPLDAPLRGFQTLVVPPTIPTNIPAVDLQEHFDPKDYSGSGVEGGRANGIVPTGSEVYTEAIVEEKPSLLSAPPPAYPDLLRQAGVQGRVLLRAIVDTTGRVEPNSVTIVKSPNPGFDDPTRRWVLKALFRPARLHGRPVRAYVSLPVDYSIITS